MIRVGLLALWLVLCCKETASEAASESALKDGDCLGSVVLEYFVYSPGGYNPQRLNGDTCKRRCGQLKLPYAGLQANKFCLCADDLDVERQSPVSDPGLCNTELGYTKFFWANPVLPLEDIELTASKSDVEQGEKITFQVRVEGKFKNVEYEIDFGDQSGKVHSMTLAPVDHAYNTVGQYHVTVVVWPTGGPPSLRMTTSATVSVTSPVESDTFSIKCPKVIEPQEEFRCQVYYQGGQNIETEANFGNGRKEDFFMPDGSTGILGVPVPQRAVVGMSHSKSHLMKGVTVLADTAVVRETHLSQVHVYAVKGGSVKLMVLRRTCHGRPCVPRSSYDVCTKNQVFCSSIQSCVPKDETKCPNFKITGYKIAAQIPFNVPEGFSAHPLTTILRPGDLLGIFTTNVVIGNRKPSDVETEDLRSMMYSAGDEINEHDLKPTGRKYLVGVTTRSPMNVSLLHSYAVDGSYPFSVTMRSPETQLAVSKSLPLNCQYYLKNVRLKVSPRNVEVKKDIELEAILEGGSNLQVVWHFGDGNKISEPVIGQKGGNVTLKRQYAYKEAGVYKLRVVAFNLLGKKHAEAVLTVQFPVTDSWNIQLNSPALLLPGSLIVRMKYTNAEPLPTNATLDISFGDGQATTWQVPSEGAWTSKAFTHNYQQPGKYDVKVKIVNLVSSKALNAKVDTLRRIMNFTTTTLYRPLEVGDFQPGYGPLKNKFPVNQDIGFFMEIDTGDVEYYIIETSNGTVLSNGTKKDVFLSFNESSYYNLTSYAYNHIQGKSDQVYMVLYVMVPVTGIDILDNVNATDDDAEKLFEISFETVGTDTCLLMDFGDGTPVRGYGEEETCNTRPSKEGFEWMRELTNPHIVPYTYRKSGDINLELVAFNDVSEVFTSYLFNVSDLNCKAPIPFIRNRVSNIEFAPENIRAAPILLYSGTIVNCNYTNEVIRKWEGYEVDNITGKSIDFINLKVLDSSRKSNLYVPPFFLKPGTYRFRLVVNLSAPEMYPPKPLIRSIATLVKVIPSPILVQMGDGAQSRITRGWGQGLNLNPKQYSLDPDNRENKKFAVSWYCRRMPDEIIDRDLPDEMMNSSEPIYDRSVLYDNKGVEQEDLGGCFGKGPGKIAITGGEIMWNTTVFKKPNVTYEILTKIEVSDRRPSWGGIRVVLLESSPPAISVRCQTEKLCYPYDPIGQKINPVRVGLIGLCSESCQGELSYEWSLYGVTNESEVHLPEALEYVVGAQEKVMALSEDFFKMYYPTYGDFIAKLAVTNEEGEKGESDLFLHINQPPEGGNCTSSPETGRALLDTFYVHCRGWLDPEGSSIEHYGFWTMNLETGVLLFLSVGPDAKTKMILPYGIFQMGVDIKDKEGAVIRTNLTIVETIAPTKQEFKAFMKDRRLENANASGDQGRMNQVSQALSTLMNIELVDDNSTGIIDDDDFDDSGNDTDRYERELAEKARTRVKMIQSVGNVMNTDTLSDLEQLGSALTSIAGRGDGIDNDGKNEIIQLLNKSVILAANIKVEAPQQLLDFCMYAVGTMGGVVTRMTRQLIDGVVMPTDRAKAKDIEYDAEVPLYGESEPEYLFDGTVPIEEAMNKAVIMQEREAGEVQISKMVKLTIKLVLTILRNIIVGESPLEFMAPSGLGLTISMFKGGALSNRSIAHGTATYVFPDVCDILATTGCSGNETIGVMAVSWPSILQSYGDSVDLLSNDSATCQLLLLNENMDILDISNTTDTFGIYVPRTTKTGESALPDPTYVYPEIKWNEQMIYHQFIIDKADSVVNMEITPHEPEAKFMIYFSYRVKPQLNHYELMIPLEDVRNSNGTYDIFLREDVVRNRTGFFYLGVVELNETFDADINWGDEVNLTAGEVKRTFSSNYSVRIYTSGCYFFNPDNKIWSADGCYVENSNQAVTQCRCNHLTAFGSGFFVMPNAIDFSYVFANAGFADNITIYMTIIVTFSLYLFILIWARRQDRKDLEKLGATPLPDNLPQDKYLYEIVFFTGNKDGAGTDSHVQFILSGEDDETEVRNCGDNKRNIFRRGEQDSFVMAVPRSLGRLTFMRIWHDNGGQGKFRSWLLSFVVVRDIQTGEKFEFICNKWFAVEKEDGQIDRLLPVAGKDEATEFNHLFSLTTQKNLADGHLWFSVFMRPPRSRFTRCQRVSCCWSLLYLSMLVNAMWYGVVPPKPGDSAISVGPLSLSPEQIGVGVMANLIVFPPSFLIITFFRKSRPRKLRPNRVSEALKKQKVKNGSYDDLQRAESRISSSSTVTLADDNDQRPLETHEAPKKGKDKKKKKKKGGRLFPWWCRYVAWFLCIASMLISLFFLWSYGVQFGDEKTKKWVTSLLISFFTSILITQPIKVFLMAMIFSSLCKSVDNDVDDAELDEEQPELRHDEEWLHNEDVSGKYERRRAAVKTVNVEKMQRIREQRQKEVQMNQIIKEIISYLFFLWILTILSYGNRDPSAYWLSTNLANEFVGLGGSDDFSELSDIASFWNWTRHVLVPGIQVGKWYNGDQPFGLRGFVDDRVNRLMGYGVLRQIRAKPNSCKVPKALRMITTDCRSYGNIINEDHNSYRPGWKVVTHDRTNLDEYHYRKASELNGLPYWAQLDVYGGGGYVFPVRGKREQLIKDMHRLETSDWIDGGTRAVFIEFSVYNAQVNLFGVCTLVAEFPPGGGLLPFYRIESIRLMRYHQGFGLFVMICEATYVLYTIYFTVREVKLMRRDRIEYFKSYWNWAEIWLIGLSYAAITMYIYRMIVTAKILKIFDRSHGNGYVKLQYVAAVDELFGYLMSFLIFLAILKFIKLLRFNKRMGVLYSILSQCSGDLTSFFVVFLIIFLAFVQFFYVVFGTTLLEFASFVRSAETALSMMQGNFDFETMCLAAPVLGPISFFVFAFVTSIILINVFITLILSAFETVKSDMSKQSNDFEIVDFMMGKMKGAVGLGKGADIGANFGETTLDEKIDEFPEKVDRLLYYIDSVYFDGNLDHKNRQALEKMVKKKQLSGFKKKNNKVQQDPASRTPILDWMEVSDNHQE